MQDAGLKKNLIFSNLYQVVFMIAPLLTAPYIARVLGADGVGVYSYTGSIQYVFSLVATLGTIAYGTREISRARDDKEERSRLFWEIELLTVITTGICIIFWGLLVAFSPEYNLCFLAYTTNLLAVGLDISWFYAGIERFDYTVTVNSIFRALAVVFTFVLVKNETDIALYILIWGLSILLGNASMWMLLPRYIIRVKLCQLSVFRHLKQTFVFFLPSIAVTIYSSLDKTLIGIILHDEKQSGYYEQATKIIDLTKSISFLAVNQVLASRTSYLFKNQKYDEIRQLIDRSIRFISFMSIGVLFGLLGLADRFVPFFFGEGYSEVVVLLYIFSPFTLIIGISNCLGTQYYEASGQIKKSTVFLLTGSAVNLLLNCLMIPFWGSNGAAIASVIAECVVVILYVNKCDGFLKFGQILRHIWKKMIAGAVMGVIIRIISMYIESNLAAILICFPTGVAIYAIVLLILRDSFVVDIFKKKADDGKMRRMR